MIKNAVIFLRDKVNLIGQDEALLEPCVQLTTDPTLIQLFRDLLGGWKSPKDRNLLADSSAKIDLRAMWQHELFTKRCDQKIPQIRSIRRPPSTGGLRRILLVAPHFCPFCLLLPSRWMNLGSSA